MCRLPAGMPAALRCALEPLRQALRVDRSAERIGEHEIAVDVGGTGEVALEAAACERCARSMSTVTGSSATVRRDLADFGGPDEAPPRVGTSC